MKDYRIKFDENYEEVGSLLEQLGYKEDKYWNKTQLHRRKGALKYILAIGGDLMDYGYYSHEGSGEYTDITIEELRELVKQQKP
jgi:hypothetical protein